MVTIHFLQTPMMTSHQIVTKLFLHLDDSDEDLVKPTASAERKALIHPKPSSKDAEEVEERKNNIEKQQDDEMDRLIQLESDIEKMANDFVERRNNIRHPSKQT